MNAFPEIQLPYERFIHKEAHESNCIYLAQPVGKRCYTWFTYYNGRPICYIVDKHCYSIPVIFDESLAKGTIIYGTIITYNSKKCFIADNIFYWEGEKCTCNYSDKLGFITQLFEKIQNYSQWLFMFPEMAMYMKTFHTVYKIYCIKIIQMNGPKIFNYIEKKCTFTVHSTSKTDIYELHNSSGFYSIAYVDTYVRSMYLRSLFGIENSLESIEESEDEMESCGPIIMECTWNESFKKWIPINLISATTPATTLTTSPATTLTTSPTSASC